MSRPSGGHAARKPTVNHREPIGLSKVQGGGLNIPAGSAVTRLFLLALAVVAACASLPGGVKAQDGPAGGITLPPMDAQNGRALYVSKKCVVCHAINDVGGGDAAPLDAANMDETANPFEFFARMWLGSGPMIAMQEDRMGEQAELTAKELGDIVAFIHDAEMQKTFSDAEIPDAIEDLMQSD